MNAAAQAVDNRCPWCNGTGADPAAPAPRTPADDTIGGFEWPDLFPHAAEAAAATFRPSLWTVRDRAEVVHVVTRGLVDPQSLHPAVHQIVREHHGHGHADRVTGMLVAEHRVHQSAASIVGAAVLLALIVTGQAWQDQTVVDTHARLTVMLLRGQGRIPD